MEQSKKKELLISLSVLFAIALIVGAVLLTRPDDAEESASISSNTTETVAPTTESTATEASPATTSEVATTDSSSTTTSTYKDGTYTSTGTYSTPEGTESITVTLTLADDVVVDTSATATMDSRESKEYTNKFLENFKAAVVSKSIDDIKLSRVSGSSLTSQGFNSAVEKIKSQAKS